MGSLGWWEVVIAACACMVVVLMITRRKLTQISSTGRLHLPPSPPAWPIFGHLFILQHPINRCLHELAQKYGPLFYLQMGAAPTVVVSSPHWAKQFMQLHDRFLINRPPMEVGKRILYNNTGLVMLKYGTEWRDTRKLYVTNILTAKQFDIFEKARQEEMALVIDAIQRRAASMGESDTINIRKLVFSAVGNMFTMMLFSKRSFNVRDAMDGRGSRFKDLVEEFLGFFGEPLLGDAIPWLTWLDTRSKRRMDRIAKEMDAFLEAIVVERIESRSTAQQLDAAKHSHSDCLDLLLNFYTKDGKIDKQRVKTGLLDIMLGGTETTGTTVEWAMAELLKNPSCLTKLQEELDTLVGSKQKKGDNCFGDKDLAKLSYLQAILKETFRLHPPAAIILREFSDTNTLDQGIQVGEYYLPRRTRVLVNVWTMGRDPTFWGKDADIFFPERFLSDLAPDFHGQNFEYLPFGAGRRQCPGIHVALTTVSFIIANLVHAMNWSIPNGVPLDLTEECAFTSTMATCLLAKPSLRTHN